MYCKKCGNENAFGTQFCTKCGTRFAEANKPPKGRVKAIFLTLGIILFVISIAGNVLLWNAYSSEYDQRTALQEVSSAASDVQTDICLKVTDYATSEHDLSQETFRLLDDCYSGLPPRTNDFDRLSERVTDVSTKWSSIQEYIDAIEGTSGGNSTTAN